MTSRRPCWRSKQRNGGHVEGVKYSFVGIELYFYANMASGHMFHYANMASGHMSHHTLHRTKLRFSVSRISGGNAQRSVSVTYPNYGNAEIDFFRYVRVSVTFPERK